MSDVFERLVFEQVEYSIRHSLLYELQSTGSCLIHAFDFMSQNLGGSVLLSKLQYMVFGHTAVKWFISYRKK